jgi:hypothetical protein
MPEETPQLPVSEQETQIEAPSFKDKLKLQRKKILIGIGVFLGVLVIAGAVFGAYKFGQKQISPPTQPTPTPIIEATPTPDPTADWETYTNTEYEYSIKYPQNVTVTTDAVQDLVSFKFPEEGKWVADLSIRHYQNTESLDPQAFYQKSFNEGKLEAEKKNWAPPSEPLQSETVKINNLKGFQVRNSAYEAYQRTTYLGQGETVVAISFYDENPNDPAQEEHLILFNLILSTFKFLPSVSPCRGEENNMGKITGKLCYPSSYLPKGQIVAKNTNTGEVCKQDYPGSFAGGGVNYTLELIAGKYILRYEAYASTKDPELFSSGYYTICVTENKCKNTELRSVIPVEVISGQVTSGIDLCDFYYLPETEPNFLR